MAASPRVNPWREALDQALRELAQAEHAFEWSDPDFCDYHIYRIQAARERVALIIRQARSAYGVSARALSGGASGPALTSGAFEEALSVSEGRH